jgi:hypothetical protein
METDLLRKEKQREKLKAVRKEKRKCRKIDSTTEKRREEMKKE